MLQAGCINLGLITQCSETFHPLHLPETYHPCPEDLSLPAQLQMPSQLNKALSIPPDQRFPYRFRKPPFKCEASLIPLGLSLVVRPTVAPPRLNKGNPLPLRSSLLLFCLGRNYTSQGQVSDLPAREVTGAEEGGRLRD